MSSSYIVEPKESPKKDDTLIIVLTDDGTLSVDQATLQNLIMNQANANVSVVRMGQAEGDSENGDLTFTVDPPAFVAPESTPLTASGTPDTTLVDPFMEMDPEQLEKLETALQSEQAKQILGENVAAMLDMLTVEEEQNTIKYAIELDHCYTSRSSPADPAPLDPLPVANSPEEGVTEVVPTQSQAPPPVEEATAKPPVKLKQPPGRPRKSTVSSAQSTGPAAKSPTSGVPRGQQKAKDDEANTDGFSTSSESSDSTASDNDSDFGPRGPRRPGVRARGGRRGLTTRGGSMAGRRRGSGKRLDVEQARRLDIEMAAAVTAMKEPCEKEKVQTPTKKQLKTIPSRKKEEPRPVAPSPEELPIDNSLQTTNQVKANLINANMIKGDMILTKPGQGRTNQRVLYLQKKVVMKTNEMRTFVKTSPNILSKDPSRMMNQIQTKIVTSEDGKLVTSGSKSNEAIPQPMEVDDAPSLSSQPVQLSKPSQILKKDHKAAILSPRTKDDSLVVKAKQSPDVKRDTKKSDVPVEPSKVEEPPKTPEIKTPEALKKHPKKDQRKSPGNADALGPALFSTPDIIRRVSAGGDLKTTDLLSVAGSISAGEPTAPEDVSALITSSVGEIAKEDVSLEPELPPESLNPPTDMSPAEIKYSQDPNSSIFVDKTKPEDTRLTDADDLQSSLDPASSSTANGEIARPTEDSVHNIISNQTGIEGEEHLLATLEMEATKHEEELLAEALLLQEHLDVDLPDPAALDGSTSAISDSLLSPTSFDTTMLTEPSSELSPEKRLEVPIEPTPTRAEMFNKKKEPSKEPIQIVRGGRVITLPPIEAPATRSKRLQQKIESKPQEVAKKEEKPKEIQREVKPDEMDSEMDDEEDEDNSDSEDDPDRLWCICKRPHNNRFMICCDVCEDWFHGKCVHVSKAMGQQMEEQGIEWVCPNCAKKKVEPTPTNSKTKPAKSSKATVEVVSQKLNESANQFASVTEKSVKQEVKQVIVMPGAGMTQCVVCKKEARNSSIYCSDACILMHAQETLTKDKPPTPTASPKPAKMPTGDGIVKPSPDARVIVFEPRTGKVLSGLEAPTTSNLKAWLKEHPTYELARPNNLSTLKIGGKTVTAIQTQGSGKIVKTQSGQAKMVYTKILGSKQTVLAASKKPGVMPSLQNVNILSKSGQKSFVIASSKSPTAPLKQTTLKLVTSTPGKAPVVTIKPAAAKKEIPIKASTSAVKQPQKSSTPRKSEPEPIRTNVRRTLAECLSNRLKETEDLTLTDEEIADLALNIEVELYKCFRDTGSKYRAKYRSLQFNIKDVKNLTLFRKIADKSLAPYELVRLSPEELASQELAEWREKETKHQLEMIKKNELELMAQAKSIVVKTHKGEQIIENDGAPTEVVDPKTSVQDIVTVLNNADNNTSSDILEDKEDTSQEELRKSIRDSSKKKKKDKERDRDRDSRKSRNRDRGSKDSKRDRSSSKSKHHRSRDRSRDRGRRRSKDGKRDKNRDRERDRDKSSKDKYKEKEKDKSNESRRNSSTRSRSSQREHRDSEKKRIVAEAEVKRDGEKKIELSPIPAEKPIEDRLWRHIEDETTTNTLDGNESDVSDREPSSTVNIKTPDINEEADKEKETTAEVETTVPVTSVIEPVKAPSQTVWRGFVNMVDVAKFFITAQEVSGNAKDLMEHLPDTVDVVGRISHETVWDYLSKVKKNGQKEILVIRLTAANDEEKIPYITLYSYLNSRSRLGVVGSVFSIIKDFYIMPFSSTSKIPPVLASLIDLSFEEHRPHLLLGILVRSKRKRPAHPQPMPAIPAKVVRKNSDRSYTPPPAAIYGSKDKLTSSTDKSGLDIHSEAVTQKTLNSLNKAQVGMSRSLLDSAAISKIVPELSSKLDLTSSPKAPQDDDDAPYSPGDIEDDVDDSMTSLTTNNCLLSASKNSIELQQKMDEINRQIEEEKQQIQSMSSSFMVETGPTLPGLGLDPPGTNDNEAYSPTDVGSFTPPPQNLAFAQPILDKVSNITIPPNLQEILANVKRQESSKVDPYLPTKPTASFLTGSIYQKAPEPTYTPTATTKDSKSTLRSLSDMDLIKKAEEELAAVAAASALVSPPPMRPDDIQCNLMDIRYPMSVEDTADYSMARVMDQPKPPGAENDELPLFPSGPSPTGVPRTPPKFLSKSGVVLNISRKIGEDGEPIPEVKRRSKSRWDREGPGDS